MLELHTTDLLIYKYTHSLIQRALEQWYELLILTQHRDTTNCVIREWTMTKWCSFVPTDTGKNRMIPATRVSFSVRSPLEYAADARLVFLYTDTETFLHPHRTFMHNINIINSCISICTQPTEIYGTQPVWTLIKYINKCIQNQLHTEQWIQNQI